MQIVDFDVNCMQFEGAYQEDGKGPSIWDTWTNNPGRNIHGDPKVHNNETGAHKLMSSANAPSIE